MKMTTIISLSHTLEEIKPLIQWSELTQGQKTFLESYDQFRIMGFQELLVMDGRQIIADCGISIIKDIIHFESIWTKEGEIL